MTNFNLYIRHLLRNKLYSTVNILSFSFALCFVLLLVVYIKNETSVDNFHQNKNRIYRIEHKSTDFSAPIADELKENYAEIEDYTRVYKQSRIISNKENHKLNIDFLAVDPSFLTMFSFPLLKGSSQNALTVKNSIVLSESSAIKFFGSVENSIDKELTINDHHKVTVTGVFKNFSQQTHFKPVDALVSIQIMPLLTGWNEFLTERGFCSMSIYFLEKENTDLPSKTPLILERFKKGFWIYKSGYTNTVLFNPLQEVYFSKKPSNSTKNNSKNLLLTLSAITFLILVLTISNYINLTIAQSSLRIKEIALKKALGSSKSKLFIQLIIESIIITLLSGSLAILLAKLLESTFNNLLQTQLHLNYYFTINNSLIFIICLCVLGGISGSIPTLKAINLNILS